MKKITALLLALFMLVGVLAGCGKQTCTAISPRQMILLKSRIATCLSM